MSSTGPRRSRVAADRVSGFLAAATAPLGRDGQPVLPAPSPAKSGPSLPPWVTASLHSVNLFDRPLVVSDDATVARGRCKTWIFITAFTLTSLVLIIFYLIQPQLAQQTITNPTLAQFQAISSLAPVCPCRNSGLTSADIMTLNTPPASNFSVNACGAVRAINDACYTGYLEGNASCVVDEMSALLWYGYMTTITTVCVTLQQAQTSAHKRAYSLQLGANAIPFSILNTTLQELVLQQMQYFGTTISTITNAVVVANTLGTAPMFDLSFNATARIPANCTCATPLSPAATPYTVFVQGCTFRAPFDDRVGSMYDSWWTCSISGNVFTFPMNLFSKPHIYALLNMAGGPGYPDQLAMVANSPLTDNSTLTSFIRNATGTFWLFSDIGEVQFDTLRSGFISIDFDAYYAKCDPTACTWVIFAQPTFLQGILTALGVISGIQTIMQMVVDRGTDMVVDNIMPRCGRMRRGGAAGSGKDAEEGTVALARPPAPALLPAAGGSPPGAVVNPLGPAGGVAGGSGAGQAGHPVSLPWPGVGGGGANGAAAPPKMHYGHSIGAT